MRNTEYMNAIAKEEQLRDIFRELESVIVAYSGGVDSSYVAYVANAELGPRAVCITGESASLPGFQRAEIDRVVEKFGFQHEVIQTDELENPSYSANNPIAVFSVRTSCIRSWSLSRAYAAFRPSSMAPQLTISETIARDDEQPRNTPCAVP